MAMAKSYLVSRGTVNNTVKKATEKATKSVDKLQNKAIKSIARKVKTLANQSELKNYTDNSGTLNVTTAGQWYSAFSKDVVNGTGDNDRIGDVVTCKSLHIKGTIYLNSVLSSVAMCRLILVRFKDNYYNSNPNIVDLLNTNDYRSFYNTETQPEEFSILHDKTYSLSEIKTPQIYFKIHKSLKNGKAHWNTGTVLNGPTSGHYYMYLISDQATASAVQVNFTHLFYFKD